MNFPSETAAFFQLFDSFRERIFILDDTGNIVFTNTSEIKFSGKNRSELVGTKPSWWREEYLKVISESPLLLDLKTISWDGLLIYCRLTLMPFQTGFFCRIEDLSLGEELEKKKTEFISIASHQLRTPLGSMRWNLEMLLASEFGKVPIKIKKILNQIYRSNLRMIDLVNDLLSVSRIDQGRVFDEPVETDIQELIKLVASDIQSDAQKRSIVGKLQFGKNPIPKITIDAKRFSEVIHNLLTNAIKYNRDKGHIFIQVQLIDRFIQISVTDEGIGIPEQNRKSIFQKYFRADNAVEATNNGTGLGLYIVKSYIEGWGGSITFTSTQNKGSTFVIRLPIDPVKKLKL